MTPLLCPRGGGRLVLALLLLAGAGTALGAQQTAPAGGQPSKAEFEAIFRARADSARMHFAAADAAFMSGMIVHHTQALVMAGMAPSHGAGPSVRTLCARIINAQKDEIASMSRWLRDRGQPVPDVQVAGTDLVVHGGLPMEMQGKGKGKGEGKGEGDIKGDGMGEGNMKGKGNTGGMDMPGMGMSAPGDSSPTAPPAASSTAASPASSPMDRPLMPGMLTHAQMQQLDRARGTDFDRLFLTGMIQHHQGAIDMVRQLFATPGAGEERVVFKLANDVQVDQATEIARMQRMLAALSATPAAP